MLSLFQNPKMRAAGLLLAGVVSIQMWPNAYGDESRHRATVVKEVELKAPNKKSSKKRRPSGEAGHTSSPMKQSSPWRLASVSAQLSPISEKSTKPKSKLDPIKKLMKVAYKQLGDPYSYGAVGPDRFDCSGFTMYVYRKALGISLPHNSGAQRAATKSVPLDKMKPGDLIFSPGHVGMYVGKGKMIHSPRTGRSVSVDAVHSRAYGAGRPLA